MKHLGRRFLWILTCVALLGSGCDEDGREIGDSEPPAPITDLVVGRPLGNSLTAAWTASGDDGAIGQATYYDLRYSTEPITESNWNRATRKTAARYPYRAGVVQGFQVIGLEPATVYYFAIKSADEEHNWSALSNVAIASTPAFNDSVPPAAVTDLTIDSTTSHTITLSWSAPGDDGMDGRAAIYDARFSILPIVSEIDWTYSAQLIGEPLPGIPGDRQSMTVTGLIPNQAFYFSIRTGDEIINWSGLSGQVFARTEPAEKIPPSAITDLAVVAVGLQFARLVWTAPGDDGDVGQADRYDMRANVFPITESNWENSMYIIGEPVPAVAGTGQSITISNLEPYRVYNVAMRTADEIPNWSPLSNVVSFVTTNNGEALIDTIPPGRTNDFRAIAVSQTAVTLRWRSSGDDGYSGNPVYNDLRYATDSITDENWETAISVEYVLPPLTAGSVMTMDVKDLMPGTVYYFALKTADEVPNWSRLSSIARAQTLP